MSALPAHPEGLIAGGLFCFILAIIFIVKAFVPQWRKKWAWGRGSGPSISVPGHLGIAVGFLLISIGLLATYFNLLREKAFFLPFLGVFIFLIAGIFDRFR